MSSPFIGSEEGYKCYNITAGEYFASRDPAIIRTVLGSCVAVCLRDPVRGVGGMNHFMLADDHGGCGSIARYGVHAMELLINDCMKLGADRRNLEAKVFGGGHVMKGTLNHTTVPESNVKFAREFLTMESISIVSIDVGGIEARKVIYYTDTGRTLLSRIQCNRHMHDPELAELKRRVTDLVVPPAPDITLF